MDNTQNFAEAGMLIRKPVSEVFNAFIGPEITKNFWFTEGSSKLSDAIVGMGFESTYEAKRRNWIIKNATISELKMMTEYPNGNMNAI